GAGVHPGEPGPGHPVDGGEAAPDVEVVAAAGEAPHRAPVDAGPEARHPLAGVDPQPGDAALDVAVDPAEVAAGQDGAVRSGGQRVDRPVELDPEGADLAGPAVEREQKLAGVALPPGGVGDLGEGTADHQRVADHGA